MKNSFDRLTSKLDTAKGRINELESMLIDTFKTKMQREKVLRKWNRIFKVCGQLQKL